MGGNAFDELFNKADALARMTPEVYKKRHAEISYKLKALFFKVDTPTELQDKKDYGDIDLVVQNPKWSTITPAQVPLALDADYQIPGNKTDLHGLFHYAVQAHKSQPVEYYQVDVYICRSRDEWNMYMLLHRFRDLGIILKEMAYAYGFELHWTTGLSVCVILQYQDICHSCLSCTAQLLRPAFQPGRGPRLHSPLIVESP
jgi:hypothetical protein